MNERKETNKASAGERVDRAAVHISRFCHPSGERRAPIHPYFAIISAFTVNLGNTLSLVTVGQSLWDDIKIMELGVGHLISKF